MKIDKRSRLDVIKDAEDAIDYYKSDDIKKEWLTKLLDILKDEKYARIKLNDGVELDVQKLANTHIYLSFFDVINHIDEVDLLIEPIIIDKLEYDVFSYITNRYINRFCYD